MNEDGRARRNEAPDRIDLNLGRLDLGGVVLLGDQQLLAKGTMGDVVFGRLFDMGQVQVQRDPERRRQKADSPEDQERMAYTSTHVVRLRRHAPQRLFVVGVNVGSMAFFFRTFFH